MGTQAELEQGQIAQPLMPCRQRGCETLTSLLEMTKGASNLPPLSLLETGTSLQKAVTVSGKRSAAEAEVGCPKCTGSIKMSLAKTTPCAFPSEMFVPLQSDSQAEAQGMALEV